MISSVVGANNVDSIDVISGDVEVCNVDSIDVISSVVGARDVRMVDGGAMDVMTSLVIREDQGPLVDTASTAVEGIGVAVVVVI